MKTILAFMISLCCISVLRANTWAPQDRLLDAVCQIESSGGRFTYGDGGLSLGHFQIQKVAWTDVVEWRKKRNLTTHDYRQNVLNPQISRIYASNYLTILHGRLKQQYNREPTPAELYAAYNMGMSSFRKCNYDIARVNPTTSAKCQQVTALMK
jgi:hypothetical protein